MVWLVDSMVMVMDLLPYLFSSKVSFILMRSCVRGQKSIHQRVVLAEALWAEKTNLCLECVPISARANHWSFLSGRILALTPYHPLASWST